MTTLPANAGPAALVAATPQERARLAEERQALLADIGAKWGKFTDQELKDLKSNDDLVDRIVAKYGVDEAIARHEADTLRAGREI